MDFWPSIKHTVKYNALFFLTSLEGFWVKSCQNASGYKKLGMLTSERKQNRNYVSNAIRNEGNESLYSIVKLECAITHARNQKTVVTVMVTHHLVVVQEVRNRFFGLQDRGHNVSGPDGSGEIHASRWNHRIQRPILIPSRNSRQHHVSRRAPF